MVDFMNSGAIDNSSVPNERAIRHIYVHIPFCARICPYCAFYKERADASQMQRFCDAVLRELDQHLNRLNLEPETIFFGGGTPTALTTAKLNFLLQGFRERLDFSQLREWTFEANPGSVSQRKAALILAHGVNRVSLGVQSWNDSLLEVLGREHNATQAEASFRLLREAGFTNLNIDLMFGVPGQTLAEWKKTLEKTVGLGPDHISAYCLTYEEDTEFFLRQARGELQSNSEVDAEFFETAIELLEQAGYCQYEISNYARPGFESIHNRAYWAGEDYLGIGPSAVSTVDARRWQNVSDYRVYADCLFAGQSPAGPDEILTPEMKRGERIALSLRTDRGVPVDWLTRWSDDVREFVELGLMRESGGAYRLTRSGKLLADSVAEAFV